MTIDPDDARNNLGVWCHVSPYADWASLLTAHFVYQNILLCQAWRLVAAPRLPEARV